MTLQLKRCQNKLEVHAKILQIAACRLHIIERYAPVDLELRSQEYR